MDRDTNTSPVIFSQPTPTPSTLAPKVLDRAQVYAVLDGERDFQDATNTIWQHNGKPPVSDELLLIDAYLRKAQDLWVNTYEDEPVLDVLRKAIAMGVRCLENNGIPIEKDSQPYKLHAIPRSDVYAVIDKARNFQESLNDKWDHKGRPSVSAEMLILKELANKSRYSWTWDWGNNGAGLNELVDFVAVGVRCFENYGVPYRTTPANKPTV